MPLSPESTALFDHYWDDLDRVGRAATGGYNRFAWTDHDHTLREWFTAAATSVGLDVTCDRVGNLWGWWGNPDVDGPGVVIGSHLDSVPDGGAFDGPLGVVSSLVAVAELKARGFTPNKPIGVACFGDEEGARFGVACAGSRLLTGALPAERGLALTDVDGITMAEAMKTAGFDPHQVSIDTETINRIGTFVELHVEQGKHLVDTDYAVAAGSAIWPHGRWRVDFTGCADHAGTTRLIDRNDPMLDVAEFIQRTRRFAELHKCVATVGKMHITPNGVNAIPSRATAWLDARGSDSATVRNMVDNIIEGTQVREESWTDRTVFDPVLTARVAAVLGGDTGPAPIIETGAGHDAGILSNYGIPTTMIHVRNPTGVSHSPAEFAERTDCHIGTSKLVDVVADLTSDQHPTDTPPNDDTHNTTEPGA